jgi:hypothetical protein
MFAKATNEHTAETGDGKCILLNRKLIERGNTGKHSIDGETILKSV